MIVLSALSRQEAPPAVSATVRPPMPPRAAAHQGRGEVHPALEKEPVPEAPEGEEQRPGERRDEAARGEPLLGGAVGDAAADDGAEHHPEAAREEADADERRGEGVGGRGEADGEEGEGDEHRGELNHRDEEERGDVHVEHCSTGCSMAFDCAGRRIQLIEVCAWEPGGRAMRGCAVGWAARWAGRTVDEGLPGRVEDGLLHPAFLRLLLLLQRWAARGPAGGAGTGSTVAGASAQQLLPRGCLRTKRARAARRRACARQRSSGASRAGGPGAE